MKAKVTAAYDGGYFYGSQHLRSGGEETLPTVLSVFECALRSMGIDSAAIHAGRTDRFVHATGQVISFTPPPFWTDADRLKAELVKKLYPKIHIKEVRIVDDDFHPRYSAKSRIYRYIISCDRPTIYNERFVTFVPEFDIELARKAIAKFVGEKDFFHFSKRGSGELSTIRTIYSAAIYAHKNLYIARFEGDAFLRSQIRLMMSAVIKIARGNAAIGDIDAQFQGKIRRFRTPAPPNGLYLARVKY
ncbi:tRNA pseudouridine synthase A [Campylobacterota bacterium]|nr:tRNA pseudouridine synthase A [Campylobacterota bacterium]